jgi:hypothetical protein
MTHDLSLLLINLSRGTRRFVGLATCVLALGTAWVPARAAGDWLTVVGDLSEPIDTAKDVVQVNPGSISDANGLRTMQIRTNRAENRTSWEGVPYRSFEAIVEFDCEKKTARYVSLNYFMEPVWRGTSHKTSTYTKEQFRAMAFRTMSPNPAARIIRAACESKSVISN